MSIRWWEQQRTNNGIRLPLHNWMPMHNRHDDDSVSLCANHSSLRIQAIYIRRIRANSLIYLPLGSSTRSYQILFTITTMSSTIAANSVRQAARLCLKQSSSSAGHLRSSASSRIAGISGQKLSRRGYVSETKKDNAQVNVDTAIRAEQKAFFAETGKMPEKRIVPGTTADAGAMMSPVAGGIFFLEIFK